METIRQFAFFIGNNKQHFQFSYQAILRISFFFRTNIFLDVENDGVIQIGC